MLGFLTSTKAVLSLITITSILSFYTWGLYQQKSKLSQELLFVQSQKQALEVALDHSNLAIEELNERIKTSQRASQELSEANTQLEKDFNAKDAELRSHLGRLEKAFQKRPKLMEKLVNKSFNKFIDQVDCNNGNLESCKD